MNSINKIYTGIYSFDEIKDSLDKNLDCNKPNKQNDVKRIVVRIFDHLYKLRQELYNYNLRNSPLPTGNNPITEDIILYKIEDFYWHCNQRFGSQKQKKDYLEQTKKFIIDNILIIVNGNLEKEQNLNAHKSMKLGNVRHLSGLGAFNKNNNWMKNKMKSNKKKTKKSRKKMPFELKKKRSNKNKNSRKNLNSLKKSLNRYRFNELSKKQGLNPRMLNKYKGGKRTKKI